MSIDSHMFYTIEHWDGTTELVMTNSVNGRSDLTTVVYGDRSRQIMNVQQFIKQTVSFHPHMWVSQSDKMMYGYPQ